MKKTKLIACMLCITLMLSCCACGLVGDRKYECNVDEVASVQIVKLVKYVEGEYRYEYEILSEISDYETFVSQLNGIKHSVNWGDPRTMRVDYVVVKVEYINGDFDLIHQDAQRFVRDGEYQSGFFFFDDEQFEALISEYLSNTGDTSGS